MNGNSEAGGRPRRLWLSRTGEDTAEGGDSFDALTDLFLGEVGRHRRETPAGDTPRAADRESRPMLRLAGLGPADEPEPEPAEIANEAVTHEPAPRREPLVECLVVGNLPVLASAWASQYVREVARASGCPVAFLRAQAGFVTLELVGADDAGEGATAAPVKDLDAALQRAAQATHRWVVRVDPADETAAAARASMRLVTLITGPDDAARLNAYGTLKELASRLPAEHGPMVRVAVMSTSPQQAEAAGRSVVDTVRQHLGRDVQHAVCSSKIAASRPARLLFNGKLDCPVAAILERMEESSGGTSGGSRAETTRVEPPAVTPMTEIVREPAAPVVVDEPVVVVPVIEDVVEVEPVVTAHETNTDGPEARPTGSETIAKAATHVERKPIEPRREDVAVVAESIIASTVSAGEMQHGRVETVVRSGLIDRIAPRSTEASPAILAAASQVSSARHEPVAGRIDDVALWSAGTASSDDAPRLTSLVAGLSESAVRCPYAEGVEVAVDAAGRVHLLVRSGGAADDDRALAALMVAGAWLDAHAALLRAVDGRVAGSRGGSRVMHLFTSAPKSSRRLLETEVRVHVLVDASAPGAGRSDWRAVELN